MATGYSASHLRPSRPTTSHAVPNAGRPGAPRIALRHLSRKAFGEPAARVTGPALAEDASPSQDSNEEFVRSIIEGKSAE